MERENEKLGTGGFIALNWLIAVFKTKSIISRILSSGI
jgi:hypothetical protein